LALAAAEMPLLWANFNPMTQTTMRLALLTFTLLALMAAPVLAAPPINDAGEAALRAQIQTLLDQQKNARQYGGGSFKTEGEILIEQADSYYAITLPDITVADAEGRSLDVGIIAINAIPDDKPGNWKLSVSMPTPMTWIDATGKPLRKMEIGTQRLSGVWNETLEAFTTLDAGYDNVQIEDYVTQTTYKIAKATILSNLKETAKDVWSGDAVATLTNLSSSSKASTAKSSADEIVLTAKISDLSAAKQKQMREKIGAFTENTNPKDLENMSPAGQLALYNMVVDVIRSAGNGFALNAAMKNIQITAPGVAGQTAQMINAKTGTLGFDITGFEQGNVTLSLRSLFDDLISTPEKPGSEGMTPSDLNLDIKLQNVPFEDLVKVGQDMLKNSGKGVAARQFAGIQAMMVLPQILSRAGTHMIVTNSTMSSPVYDAKINGKMSADATSSAGAVGKMKAEIAGLEAVIANLQGRVATADVARKAALQKTIQTLTVLNLAGQAEKRGDKTVKIYDFELTPQGQMLLNGSDLSVLTGAPGPVVAPKADTPKAR
jgi:hypothetical protein